MSAVGPVPLGEVWHCADRLGSLTVLGFGFVAEPRTPGLGAEGPGERNGTRCRGTGMEADSRPSAGARFGALGQPVVGKKFTLSTTTCPVVER